MNFIGFHLRFAAACVIVLGGVMGSADEYLNGITWVAPPVVTPGAADSDPPSDAVMLYRQPADIANWNNGENWSTDGEALIAGKGYLVSKQEFGDCQVHVEWSAPKSPTQTGQARGNSGIFLMGKYELQVLDSYQSETYFDGQAGAIYKQTPPAVNAMRPPGQWNAYDIFWTAPRFDSEGALLTPAYITAMHNGVLIINHFALKGTTPYDRPPAYAAHPAKGPLSLQDHGNPVRFRNIWVREFIPASGTQDREPFFRNDQGVERPISATASKSD